jgi:hypothetical protein
MSRTFFSLDWKERVIPRLPAPVRYRCRWVLVFCSLVLAQFLRGSICVASLSSSDDVIGSWGWQAGRLPGRQHIDLSEARGLELFRVVREGIGISRRLSARWALQAYRRLGYSLSNPSVSRTDRPTPEKDSLEMERVLTRDAQAACDFSFSASKFSPFFHNVRVTAAILRASVSRTMVGLMPLARER